LSYPAPRARRRARPPRETAWKPAFPWATPYQNDRAAIPAWRRGARQTPLSRDRRAPAEDRWLSCRQAFQARGPDTCRSGPRRPCCRWAIPVLQLDVEHPASPPDALRKTAEGKIRVDWQLSLEIIHHKPWTDSGREPLALSQ